MKQQPTIVLTGGGSGGHITPLLPLAHELKKQAPDCRIIYIGHKGDKFDNLQLSSSDFDFLTFINGGKFRRYHGESLLSHIVDFKTLALNVRDFFRVLGGIGAAWRILGKFKPDVVFSKGGFVVVPVGIAARVRRIPIVTHDSDTVPGLANRIVGRWAKVNATGMPTKYYAYPKDRTVYVGIPTAANLTALGSSEAAALRRELSLPTDGLVVLVSGGGNGSRTLNNLMVSAAPELLSTYPHLYIVHVSGQKHEADVIELYKASLAKSELPRVKVFGFTSDFHKYSGVADLIVGRAGATSLAEFAAQRKACLVIPSPFLAGGHQMKNAQDLAERDAAVVADNAIQVDEFIGLVGELLRDDRRRHQLADNLATMAKPNAAKELATIILKVASKQRIVG